MSGSARVLLVGFDLGFVISGDRLDRIELLFIFGVASDLGLFL